jgi:hypothetical protein
MSQKHNVVAEEILGVRMCYEVKMLRGRFVGGRITKAP